MQCEYRILTEHALGVVWLRGRVTGAEIVQCLRDLHEDRRWVPGYASIWNTRGVSELIISPSDVQAVTEEVERSTLLCGAGPFSVVVKREMEHDIANLLLVKMRMREGTVHTRNTKVFWSMGAALEWLQILEPSLEPLHPRRRRTELQLDLPLKRDVVAQTAYST